MTTTTNDATNAMRDNLIKMWGTLEWRHHGTGMLQAYVPGENARVHVWHPKLLLSYMTTSGALHNHRFTFVSTVLAGAIAHTHLHVQESTAGAHQLFNIENASKGRDCDLVAGPRVTLTMEPDEIFAVNRVYEVGKWRFHWARPHYGLAVTWVQIHDKEEQKTASLVCPYGTTPVHAFTHQRDARLEAQLLRGALRFLRGEVPFVAKVPEWAGMDDFPGSDY